MAGRALPLFALFAFGCTEYTQVVVAKVEDPRRVAVIASDAHGEMRVALPPEPEADRIEATIGEIGKVSRAGDGSLTFIADHPWAEPHTPLTGDGVLVVHGRSGVDILRSDRGRFRVLYIYSTRVTTYHGAPSGAGFGAILTTPWSNVVEVRERRTVDRGGGVVLMLLGAAATVLGTVVLVSAVSDSNASPPAVYITGSALVAGGIVLGAFGGMRAFATDEERIVYPRPR